MAKPGGVTEERAHHLGECALDGMRDDTTAVASWLAGLARSLCAYPEDDPERNALDDAAAHVRLAAMALSKGAK